VWLLLSTMPIRWTLRNPTWAQVEKIMLKTRSITTR
jgi:hypothetical protein